VFHHEHLFTCNVFTGRRGVQLGTSRWEKKILNSSKLWQLKHTGEIPSPLCLWMMDLLLLTMIQWLRLSWGLSKIEWACPNELIWV
jgi:hypothetical protein